MRDNELLAGLVRLHILHHASKTPVYGLWIIEELGHHGYKLSAGTLYPVLHGLEAKGYLISTTKKDAGVYRRMYRITAQGRRALKDARKKVKELFGEMFEE